MKFKKVISAVLGFLPCRKLGFVRIGRPSKWHKGRRCRRDKKVDVSDALLCLHTPSENSESFLFMTITTMSTVVSSRNMKPVIQKTAC